MLVYPSGVDVSSSALRFLAALAPTLAEAVRAAATRAYLISDGTLLAIDCRGGSSYHSSGVIRQVP
ncbi:hypothetical protein GCM10010347_60940 [Streptomyces cirratus]|uniref:Uncharacterized protein n=1 Tax=Streptomyces cirratus TaxID=68187 RepID=A0ABQ3F550_9ACTN|nr:hypothetical protein GCM10010347_60940 [Streptomyces cirratus]